jgi:hypothetical protein
MGIQFCFSIPVTFGKTAMAFHNDRIDQDILERLPGSRMVSTGEDEFRTTFSAVLPNRI